MMTNSAPQPVQKERSHQYNLCQKCPPAPKFLRKLYAVGLHFISICGGVALVLYNRY